MPDTTPYKGGSAFSPGLLIPGRVTDPRPALCFNAAAWNRTPDVTA